MEENSIELANPMGYELATEEGILPRHLAETYYVIDGKFFNRKTNVLAFEDLGNKLIYLADKYIVEDRKYFDKETNILEFEIIGNKIIYSDDNQEN